MNRQPDTRENHVKEYRPRITTSIVLGFAIVCMSIGIIMLFLGIVFAIEAKGNLVFGISAVYLIPAGLIQILFSSLLYIIGALSKDVFKIASFLDYKESRDDSIYRSLAMHLQQIEINQESMKNGIAFISSKLENRNERTEVRRINRNIEMGE